MTIRKKQRLFINAYTDRTNPTTFENGTKSAEKSGYSPKHAACTASILLKREDIRLEINRINKEYDKRYSDSLENKIKIAWDLFIESKNDGKLMLAQKWYEEHGKLCGHYSQNINFKDKTDRTPEERKELSQIRNRIFGANTRATEN